MCWRSSDTDSEQEQELLSRKRVAGPFATMRVAGDPHGASSQAGPSSPRQATGHGSTSAMAAGGAASISPGSRRQSKNYFGQLASSLVMQYGPPRIEAVTQLLGITLGLAGEALHEATVSTFRKESPEREPPT